LPPFRAYQFFSFLWRPCFFSELLFPPLISVLLSFSFPFVFFFPPSCCPLTLVPHRPGLLPFKSLVCSSSCLLLGLCFLQLPPFVPPLAIFFSTRQSDFVTSPNFSYLVSKFSCKELACPFRTFPPPPPLFITGVPSARCLWSSFPFSRISVVSNRSGFPFPPLTPLCLTVVSCLCLPLLISFFPQILQVPLPPNSVAPGRFDAFPLFRYASKVSVPLARLCFSPPRFHGPACSVSVHMNCLPTVSSFSDWKHFLLFFRPIAVRWNPKTNPHTIPFLLQPPLALHPISV